MKFGSLDEQGHVVDPDDKYRLWNIAAYLPPDREAEVAKFLADHGIEVYRMWAVVQKWGYAP
jgi:hypothetical protein